MKSLTRSLVLWIALTGIAWLLQQPELPLVTDPISGVVRLFSLALAVILTWAAVVALPAARLWRWSFCAITIAGWLAVGRLAEIRFESAEYGNDRQVLLLAVIAALITLVWIALRATSASRLIKNSAPGPHAALPRESDSANIATHAESATTGVLVSLQP
jgi:hypothetical protein